jgi:YegS/Rv2252/BmrU family lipid kinase
MKRHVTDGDAIVLGHDLHLPIIAEAGGTLGMPAAAASAAGRRIVAIVNPATHGDAATIVALLHRRAPAGVDLDVRLTPAPGTTTALTREVLAEDVRVAIAVGGDGTVADVATALVGTGIPLGIVPGGSTNVTARSLGIPADPAAAVALLFAARRTVEVDLGLADSRVFLHMAGAGLDSRLFADANPARKRQLGWLAYLPPALHDLALPPARFTVVADGITTEATSPLVLICNGGTIISPHLSLYPGIRTDDGLLDILIFTPRGTGEIAETLARLATHGLDHSPHVTHLRARHVVLASEPSLPMELDGDVVLQTPVAVSLAPAPLRVIIPPQ